MTTLPFRIQSLSAELLEIKTIGLILIFVYAFFKFSWSYRLYTYVNIMLGGAPIAEESSTPEAQKYIRQITALFKSAGHNLGRGQQAFSFALGYLGWFISPWALIVTSVVVTIVLWQRQFGSEARISLPD